MFHFLRYFVSTILQRVFFSCGPPYASVVTTVWCDRNAVSLQVAMAGQMDRQTLFLATARLLLCLPCVSVMRSDRQIPKQEAKLSLG